jgi:hypothetical protein
VIGIVGLAVGIASVGTSVGLLAAAVDRRDEAADLRDQIKAEWNDQDLGDETDPMSLEAWGYRDALPYYSNLCGERQSTDLITAGAPDKCSDLQSAADDHAAFTAAGFFLLVGGSALTLGSALYLAVGGATAEGDSEDTAVRVVPTVGPSQWGVAMGGTF